MELISWCGIDDSNYPIATEAAAYEMDLPKSGGPNDYNRPMITCPSCGHPIELYDKGRIHELPGLPAGVKFDPTDHEILEHLQAKVMEDGNRLHPLIDEFIPTLEGENGICCTHPEKLPGVRRDGLMRHFFHRPSKAYTTGTRKRRKVGTGVKTEGETRWHKTGKTRPILVDGMLKGFKKILVLYTNYGKQRKPEKTNWVMHQYHVGDKEDEKDGELVASKVFYQTQPRVCASTRNKNEESTHDYRNKRQRLHGKQLLEEYGYGNSGHFQSGYEFIQHNQTREMTDSPHTVQLIPNKVLRQEDKPLFAQFVGTDEQTWKKAV